MAKHIIDNALMKELKSRTFEDFNDLAKYLRIRIGINRREMATKINKSDSYGVYIRQVEIRKDIQSPEMVAEYIRYFRLQTSYVIDLDTITLDKQYINRINRRRETINNLVCH